MCPSSSAGDNEAVVPPTRITDFNIRFEFDANTEALEQVQERIRSLALEIDEKSIVSVAASPGVMGQRRVRVVADGDPMHTRVLDLATGEDLTEKYCISSIVVFADARQVNATVVFHGVEADVEALLVGARTDEQQREIVEANDAAVEQVNARNPAGERPD